MQQQILPGSTTGDFYTRLLQPIFCYCSRSGPVHAEILSRPISANSILVLQGS